MGRSNSILFPVYDKIINQLLPNRATTDAVALGSPKHYATTTSVNANWDFFDLSLGNWDINTDWELPKQYNFLVSTRCPYFCKHPNDFISKCHKHLKPGGSIFIDWGYGDHWRFPTYKIGWVKNGEQEYCYGDTNYLWSGVWDDAFLIHPQYKLFEKWVQKLGYNDVKKAIHEETPSILSLNYIKKYFNIEYDLLALWENSPQLYIFIYGIKI